MKKDRGAPPQVIDPAELRMGHSRDPWGQVRSVDMPDGRVVRYRYDPLGRITEMVDGPIAVTYEYDTSERSMSRRISTGVESYFRWNDDEQVTLIRHRRHDGPLIVEFRAAGIDVHDTRTESLYCGAMGGRLEFDFTFDRRGKSAPRAAAGAAFRLLLVSDFRGRAAARAREGRATPLRRPLLVDAGDIDRAVASFAPSWQGSVAPGSGSDETMAFGSMDELHPDWLYRHLPRFAMARCLRQALASPGSSEEALRDVQAWLTQPSEREPRDAPAAATAPGDTARESTDSTLSRLLGRAPADTTLSRSTAAPSGAAAVIDALVAKVAVASHVSSDVAARRKLLLTAMDEKLGHELRAVLTAPEFRALEAAWRGAERVIRALNTDEDLQIGLLDACKDDLVDAVASASSDVEQSELHKLIVDGESGWSVIAVGFAFDRQLADLRLLATLGAIAARSGAVLLGDATPALLGAPDWASASDPATWKPPSDAGGAASFWDALRASPIAPSIALALPRVLARLPYGKKTDPVAELPFEELLQRAGTSPEQRVWSSAAFALAELLGRAFREQGWQMDTGGQLELDDLPAHTFDAGGAPELVPCTEVLLGERAAAAARVLGIVPLLAYRDRATVRVASPASIASDGAALAGAWWAAH